MGTDDLGRDYLPRVVEGIGSTFLLSSIAVVITGVLGTLLGMMAGYLQGVATRAAGLADPQAVMRVRRLFASVSCAARGRLPDFLDAAQAAQLSPP